MNVGMHRCRREGVVSDWQERLLKRKKTHAERDDVFCALDVGDPGTPSFRG